MVVPFPPAHTTGFAGLIEIFNAPVIVTLVDADAVQPLLFATAVYVPEVTALAVAPVALPEGVLHVYVHPEQPLLLTDNATEVQAVGFAGVIAGVAGTVFTVIFSVFDCAVVCERQLAFEVSIQYTLVFDERLLRVSEAPVPDCTPPTYHVYTGLVPPLVGVGVIVIL
jgi:hypothetical protein